MGKKTTLPRHISTLLRAQSHLVLSELDPDATPGFSGDKETAEELTTSLGIKLSDLQERLYAQGKDSDAPDRRILVILQGMDTSGKGGTVRHVFGLVDPQGLALHAFKQPTQEERKHSFLWRIRQHLPGPGFIGIFDRSHYEDVLVARVDHLVPPSTWRQRYRLINDFEHKLVASGTVVIKCFLHISADEQKARLLERLEDPEKHWKYSPGDVEVRSKWDQYMEAYEAAINRCSTESAPWYVIPANKKWYRDLAIATLLLEALEGMELTWPIGEFDADHEIAAVENSLPAMSSPVVQGEVPADDSVKSGDSGKTKKKSVKKGESRKVKKPKSSKSRGDSGKD